MSAKPSKAKKPTVFLSHSSKNQLELLALKRLLDERASGMIEFFLSSDDVSIPHGTIWPAQVRAALDRMHFMLVFASKESLESEWTYFEAGYGLHKLDSANIYCLPGTNKDSLRSPFNLLQNRNLHSAKDVSSLIRQLNERFGARMNEAVSKADYDLVFRKSPLTSALSSPPLGDVIESIHIETEGPYDSADLFRTTCSQLDHRVSVPEKQYDRDDLCSTGIRISVRKPRFKETIDEIEITESERQMGRIEVHMGKDSCYKPSDSDYYRRSELVEKSVQDIEKFNLSTRQRNALITKQNEALERDNRPCTFTLHTLDLSVPTAILDSWLNAAQGHTKPLVVTLKLQSAIGYENRVEVIGAKIHRSQLSLRSDGGLLWREKVLVDLTSLRYAESEVRLKAIEEVAMNFGDFHAEELIATLCELQVLLPPARNGGRAKKR